MSLLQKPAGAAPEEAEMARILALAIEELPGPEDVEIFSFDNLLAEAFGRGERLWPVQVGAVEAYRRHGGGLFPIRVGWGKTGVCLMIAEEAYRRGVRKILLVVPPQLVPGLVKRHVPEWRRRVSLSVPMHFIAGRARAARKVVAESGAPGLYVFPYSLLSAMDAVPVLQAIGPQLVIADEAHNLANPTAGRTKVLLSVLKETKARLVAMSASITSKHISDYHHLATHALGHLSPLPRSNSMAFFWGQMIDSDACEPSGHAIKLMRPLLEWAARLHPEEKFRPDQTESYRRAYKHRFTTAPGVVASGEEEISVSLRLENIEPAPHGARLQELMDGVEENYETPQGEPIDHALHKFKWLYELSHGFFNSLVWPTPEQLMQKRRVSLEEAKDLLRRARAHLACQQEYHKLLRAFFDTNDDPTLATPRQVGLNISLHGGRDVGDPLAAAWRAMHGADFPGRPEREQVAVRVDDYKVRRAVEWAREFKHGLVWVHNLELALWTVEAMAEAGLDPLHAPAGANDLIEDVGDPGRGGKGDRLVVASMPSHNEGRNLQAFQNQLYLQWPRPARIAEQSLGRTHRNGQKADELVVHTMLHTEFDHQMRAACLNEAVYVQQTTSARQKILYCDYEPMPLVYSPEFLREKGLSPEELTESQRETLARLFGAEVA